MAQQVLPGTCAPAPAGAFQEQPRLLRHLGGAVPAHPRLSELSEGRPSPPIGVSAANCILGKGCRRQPPPGVWVFERRPADSVAAGWRSDGPNRVQVSRVLARLLAASRRLSGFRSAPGRCGSPGPRGRCESGLSGSCSALGGGLLGSGFTLERTLSEARRFGGASLAILFLPSGRRSASVEERLRRPNRWLECVGGLLRSGCGQLTPEPQSAPRNPC